MKYLIDKKEGFIYILNGDFLTDELNGHNTLLDNIEDYKEITKEEYLDIYYAWKNGINNESEELFLQQLIDKVL